VDLGSLGRAARLLRISQPALSKRLRALEALAGTKLLDRSTRGVSPTPMGSRLYTEARKLLSQADAVEALMSGLSEGRAPVRLAASHTIAEFVLPAPLMEFEASGETRHSVELLSANSIVVRDLVREGRVELGIAAVSPAGSAGDALHEIPFLTDEVVVAVPVSHRWAHLDEIEVSDFLAERMLMRDPGADTRRSVELLLAQEGIALAEPLVEVGSTSSAKAVAIARGAPALLSTLALQDPSEGLIAKRVRDLRFHRQFAVLIAGEEALSAAGRALVNHLLQTDNS
jgi:DNA-binding transcriptional LysR family regulator